MLRYVTLPEKMMNCSCKVVQEHSLLLSNRVYALYFDVVMNCYLIMRTFMIKFIIVIIMIMMLLCLVFIDTSLSLNMWTLFFYRLSLDDKQGLSLGELIRPFASCFPTVICSVFIHYYTLWSNSNVFSLIICQVYTKREITMNLISNPSSPLVFIICIKTSDWYL